MQRSNSGLAGLSFKIGDNAGENARDRDAVDKEKNLGGVGGSTALPPPPTLEELGMSGLVNYEVMERTMNGSKRRRWRV